MQIGFVGSGTIMMPRLMTAGHTITG